MPDPVICSSGICIVINMKSTCQIKVCMISVDGYNYKLYNNSMIKSNINWILLNGPYNMQRKRK